MPEHTHGGKMVQDLVQGVTTSVAVGPNPHANPTMALAGQRPICVASQSSTNRTGTMASIQTMFVMKYG
jgi:hypothetical protein